MRQPKAEVELTGLEMETITASLLARSGEPGDTLLRYVGATPGIKATNFHANIR